MVVVAVSAPLVPFTVSVYEPAVTLDATLIVTAEVVAVGLVANVPVIPTGQLDAARVTAALNPLTLFTVAVELPLEPETAVAALADNVKLGEGAVTESAIVVLAVSAPLVPLIVREYEPGTTEDATLIVTADVPVVGLVPNTPVIPTGQLAATRVTAPLNPPAAVTVTVDAPLAPAATPAAVDDKVKLGTAAPVTVSVPNCCHDPLL